VERGDEEGRDGLISRELFGRASDMPALAVMLIGALIFAGVTRAQAPRFDGDSAYQFLLKQVEMGPRNPGSEGHAEAVRSFEDWFEKTGGRVRLQYFKADVPTSYEAGSPREKMEGVNIIAHYGPEGPTTYLLCAHYDTRPWADHDPDESRRDSPILGANDGASGVAVLLEMARLFSEQPPPMTVEIVLFDLEDSGVSGDNESYALGSQHYARHRAGPAPAGAVLVDLIGDSNLSIPKEYFSYAYARDWTDYLFRLAEEVGSWAFEDRIGEPVYDDHVPLLRAGIPACNFIDFDYSPWHTHADLPEACSPESLAQVGRVLTRLIYEQ
jgi:hypothetical protein